MQTIKGKRVELLHHTHPENLTELLLTLRSAESSILASEILHNPLLLPDIEKAIARIDLAQKNKEKVMIFGDYDVDGISSTAALFLFLRDELGLEVSYRLPHRVHDGYGIKSYHMDEIAATGSKLVITVDCGTKDILAIEYAGTLGMDVIVTDHHSCPDVLPNCVAVVNPKRKDSKYPFLGLSGSGVVWKLMHAILLTLVQSSKFKEQNEGLLKNSSNVLMFSGEGIESVKNPQLGTLNFELGTLSDTLTKYIDIIALGTVADCMPMIDENRTIVRRGILQSQQSHHPFFQTFVDTLKRPILTEEDIGFFVGPMLNAGGRLTTPYQSISTLLAGSLDSFAKIQELIAINETRKGKSRDSFEKAVKSVDPSAPLLIYIDENLEHGILGLVAAKLTELYHKPSAVFTLHEGMYVGSFRAPPGIDLVQILDDSRSTLSRYGGHAAAAGCSIEAVRMSEACVSLVESTVKLYNAFESIPTIRVDTILDHANISLQTIRDIEILRPFGIGFSAPLFLLRNITAPIVPLGQTGEHIRWDVPGKLEILGFRFGEYRDKLTNNSVSLIGTLKSHTWRDTVTPQFHVMDVVIDD